MQQRLITLPTSFSADFIPKLALLNEQDNHGKVFEVYGSFQNGFFHSARPAKYLPSISKDEFKTHVSLGLKHNIRFNYLLNAPSYGNYEYTHTGQTELEQLLHFLCDAGVASVTVTTPYLIELIAHRFPQLEVVVSTIGYVNAKRGIDQFTNAGAKRIVLDVEANRDFRFLRHVTAKTKTDLEIVVNPVCLYQCHFKYNHYCTASFGAKPHKDGCGHPYSQYYLNWCYLEKLKNLGEFMRSPWVRPEDVPMYEEIGVRHFKIAGRGLSTDDLLSRARFYLEGHFSGNLLELLGWRHWLQFRKTADGQKLAPLDIILENDDLSGFMDYFHKQEPLCYLGCEGCGHCDKWAKKHVTTNNDALLKSYIETMQTSLNTLVSTMPTADETKQQQIDWNQAANNQGLIP